ncbi:RimJ/RimL family protein N-acetyltransferase [Curtobacterium luteum]|uniref:Acetyltransferase n=1 Tax=Curtobacterium luteum TaxID=33881 RepID=A0A8H9L0T8_9MICO|nr:MULTISPECIES: GNAT family N-acetyltransferase [Curtobacterium]MBM7803732.1 RimJ/RimL family protein N-acetyltransferase [Curtobacterium luteum]NUU51543.1 GNAT family N-acetyltransferase [Curtobacterium luteum]GGL02911.1 acetyltransferase [Curtobacterium luteum]
MVHQLLVPPQEIRTDRLLLSPLTPGDVVDVHALFSDARTWQHLPEGRHRDRAQTVALVQAKIGGRIRHGLGSWLVRSVHDGGFLGVAGVDMTAGHVWNLGYRFVPESWGNGYATEAAVAAVRAAHDAAPDVPVTGRVLTNNPGSAVVLRRAGLSLVWQGTTAAPTPVGVERQVWADRGLTDEQHAWLVEHA